MEARTATAMPIACALENEADPTVAAALAWQRRHA
jgi:hypothetical protein